MSMFASKPYAVYDIEVFSHDALVVFQDLEGNQIGYWHNDFEGILEFVKGHVLVGYNNYWYDDHILSKMINCWTPFQLKELNDLIIAGNKSPHPIHPDIVSLDCFQQIDVSRPGLKKVEGNMGKRILESSVPFDIDRPLTEQELEEVVEYCSYDVAMTGQIFKMRQKTYFDTKQDVVGMMGKSNPNAYRWNTTTISANVLLDKPLPKWSSPRVPEHMFDLVPEEVEDMWRQEYQHGGERKTKKVTVREFENDIEFGFGGLHSVHRTRKEFRDVKLWDVTLTTSA